MFAASLLALAIAVPGPDSTAIIANLNNPESVSLAEAYRRARSIPREQMCLLDLPDSIDITLDEYRSALLDPFRACLGAALARIEAAALIRGIPLRVAVPLDASRSERVSLAAALSVWEGRHSDGTPILGLGPGTDQNCGGTPCYAAAWSNAYRRGVFRAGWTGDDRDGHHHKPLLVTMLHGRSYEDAARLFTSALDAEMNGGARGTFMLMNGADPARGVLDFQYDNVIMQLQDRGFDDVVRVPFDTMTTGSTLAAFFVGTAGLGVTIEGNTFLPGAIVDNVTSYGAAPENFNEAGETQVSIARWVARGVAGVHGTTDEPLNNVFPSRLLLISYVDGFTLAESYFAAMPYAYWRNLVLGDPMAAPYATRPNVQVEGTTSLVVTADHPEGIASLLLFANGSTIASATRGELTATLELAPDEELELLAVAQARGTVQPKGWIAFTVRGEAPADAGLPDTGQEDSEPMFEDAAEPVPDAGVLGAAEMTPPVEEESCACTSTGSSQDISVLALFAALACARFFRIHRNPR